jgi:polyisoprenoid-binding protein YceI
LKRIGVLPSLVAVLGLSLAVTGMAGADGTSQPGRASFSATATGGLKIDGKTAALASSWDGDTVVVTLPLGSLETGIGLRDKHLRNQIESDKFPLAELRVPLSALQLPAPGASASGSAQAPLSFHGQVKPVSFTWQAKRGDGFEVTGALQLDYRDYGVAVPSYLGITVKPMVDVAVAFHLAEPRAAAAPPAASAGAGK